MVLARARFPVPRWPNKETGRKATTEANDRTKKTFLLGPSKVSVRHPEVGRALSRHFFENGKLKGIKFQKMVFSGVRTEHHKIKIK